MRNNFRVNITINRVRYFSYKSRHVGASYRGEEHVMNWKIILFCANYVYRSLWQLVRWKWTFKSSSGKSTLNQSPTVLIRDHPLITWGWFGLTYKIFSNPSPFDMFHMFRKKKAVGLGKFPSFPLYNGPWTLPSPSLHSKRHTVIFPWK